LILQKPNSELISKVCYCCKY